VAPNLNQETVVEQLIEFNGVKVLLTTGQSLNEVQNMASEADVIISVYPGNVRVLYDFKSISQE